MLKILICPLEGVKSIATSRVPSVGTNVVAVVVESEVAVAFVYSTVLTPYED